MLKKRNNDWIRGMLMPNKLAIQNEGAVFQILKNKIFKNKNSLKMLKPNIQKANIKAC